MLSLLLVAALLPIVPASAPDDPVQLASTISEVVVYGGSARVTRSAEITAGGEYTLSGLPGSLDKDTVRVRLGDGHVVGVEVRDRQQPTVPGERVAELRRRVSALESRERELDDEHTLTLISREHLETMLKQEGSAHAGDVGAGRPNVDAWRASLQFLTDEMRRVAKDQRVAEQALEQVRTELADLRRELGRADSGGVHLVDVVLDVMAAGPTRLDVEYQVPSAGWRPLYDLRTAGDARSVDLAYRAQVWQHTGEDWSDVGLALSTAQPQRGAQGPDPRPIRLGLIDPAELTGRGRAARAPAVLDDELYSKLEAIGYASDSAAEAPAPSPFAGVVAQGLSVQFHLPRHETIESRDQPTTVLVGQQTLQVEPEHYTTPALDPTVWVRGLTENSTPWTMLPGDAAVYFGGDYIGKARFVDAVQPGQEFTLHLGADPGLVATRELTEDLHEEPGFLSDRQARKQAWRVVVANHGAHPAASDGSVIVIVREAVPLTSDDRLTIELLSESVRASRDERWKRELDEGGIHTWLLPVPRGGEAEVTWRLRTSWPEGVNLSGGTLR